MWYNMLIYFHGFCSSPPACSEFFQTAEVLMQCKVMQLCTNTTVRHINLLQSSSYHMYFFNSPSILFLPVSIASPFSQSYAFTCSNIQHMRESTVTVITFDQRFWWTYILVLCPVNLNIPASKLQALQNGPKRQNGDFPWDRFNDSD
jgi:hypothetical protein